jgi:hypothetical protein
VAENFGIFIASPGAGQEGGELTRDEFDELFSREVEDLSAEDWARLSGDEDEEDEESAWDVEVMPVLPEVAVRSQLEQLGAQLAPGEDEGSWEHGTVAYDFSLCRGVDEQLRMVDGSMHYLSLGGTRSSDVRAVFTGLRQVAVGVGAGLYQTGGVAKPEAVDAGEVERWVREVSDVLNEPGP